MLKHTNTTSKFTFLYIIGFCLMTAKNLTLTHCAVDDLKFLPIICSIFLTEIIFYNDQKFTLGIVIVFNFMHFNFAFFRQPVALVTTL